MNQLDELFPWLRSQISALLDMLSVFRQRDACRSADALCCQGCVFLMFMVHCLWPPLPLPKAPPPPSPSVAKPATPCGIIR